MAARKREQEPELSAAEKEFDVDDKSTPKKDKSGGVEVEIGGDDEEEPSETTQPETPVSRQQKRRERRAIIEENERLRQEAADARAAAQHAAGYAQGLSQQARAPQQPSEDPLAREEKELLAEMDRLVAENNMLDKAKGTPEQYQDLKKRAWDFDARKTAFLAKKAGISQQAPNRDVEARTLLMARYPDVMGDERVFQWAQMAYNQQLLEGKPNDWNTRDYVADMARERFGLKQQRRRGDESGMREKLVGTPKGGTGAAESKPNTVRLSDKQVDEARAAYPHLKESEALAKYAKGLLRGQRA